MQASSPSEFLLSPSPGATRPLRTRTARSKYVLRACQECRRRRAKCDGQKPSCSRCLDRGLSCVFSTNVDHRGSAPRSYVSLLQTRITLLEQVLQLHAIDVDASLAQITALRPESDADPSPGSRLSEPPLEHFKAIPYRRSAPRGHGNGDYDAPFFGPTSGRLDLPTRPEAGHLSHRNSPLNLQCPDEPEIIIPRNPIQKPDSLHTELRTQHLPLQPSTELHDHLIDLYFTWEQPWLQVVDEALFRDSRRNNGRYYSALLLDCMLALASRYCDRTEVRSDPLDPNTAGMVFIQAAEARLQSELTWPRITTVQSLAIMAIFYVAVGSDAAGWLHHGMAIRLILDMGLNVDAAGLSRLPGAEVELRRQIYWSLYCSDKLWASYTGRVCTMLDAQGSVPLMESSCPDGDLSDPLAPRGPNNTFLTTFLRSLSTQCQILERILNNLYAPKGLEGTRERRLFFDNCFLDLQSWLFALPKELKVDSNQPNSSPHVYILNLCFHTCIILLAKPFLPKRASWPQPQLTPDTHWEQRALGLCRQAAKDICYLGNRYRGAFGSFRRSPLTATHCTLTAALMTLFLAKGSCGDLSCCVSTLGELSESWTPARRYWQALLRVLGDVQGSKAQQSSTERAGSRVGRQTVYDMAGSTQVQCPSGLSTELSCQPTDLTTTVLPRPFDDGALDGLNASPPLDFSQLGVEQLDFGSLCVLPLDYFNYNGPTFDFQWIPQI